MKNLTLLLSLLVLTACQSNSTPEITMPVEPKNAGPQTVEVGSVVLELNEKNIADLRAQESINDQFIWLYRTFIRFLDRTDNVVGPDENKNGIRDDIEAFIDALQVEEPIRNAIKQSAHQAQENLYYDFSIESAENIKLAREIASKFEKVVACKRYVGMAMEEVIETSKTMVSLTYNSQNRTIAFLKYNRLLDGFVSTPLHPKAEYCETY